MRYLGFPCINQFILSKQYIAYLKLLSRPVAKPYELLPCYLHRLANANGYRNIQTLMKTLGEELTNTRVPSKRLFFGDFDLGRLAYLLNSSEDKLQALQLTNACATRAVYHNQYFLTKAIDFTNLKVCPHCYIENPQLDLLNVLKIKSYCSRHKCALLVADQETRKKLSWSTHYLDKKIRKSVDIPQDNDVSESEFALNRHIENLWYSGTSDVYPKLPILSLSEFLDVAHFIVHYHFRAFPHRYESTHPFNVAHWYLTDWPCSYFKLLEHFEHNPMNTKRLTGIRRCYRDLYDELYARTNAQSQGYQFLISNFESYIREYFSSGALIESFKLLSANTVSNAEYINEKQACKLLSAPKSKLRVYVREKLLKPHKRLHNGSYLYKRGEVSALFKRLSHCLTLSDASSLLGITNYLLKDLILSKVISPLLVPSKDNRDWLIEKKQIELLIFQLKHKAKQKVKRVANRYQTKRLRFKGINLSSQIKQMLDGDIDFNYRSLARAPLSLEQFIPIINKSDELNPKLLTPQQVCKRLGINKNVIYDFVKRGFVEGKKLNVNRTSRPVLHITATSVDKFQTQYYLRHQLKQLKDKNYELVSGAKIDGGLVNVYKLN